MKLSLIGVAALLLGLLGGALVGGNRIKNEILSEREREHAPPRPAWEQQMVLSEDHDEEGFPVEAAPQPSHDEQDEEAGTPEESGEPPVEAEELEMPPMGPAPAPVVEEAVPDSAAMQLARIFSAMDPAGAAAVLQRMTDQEVESIIQHVQARLAGQILGEFEPERAAVLSRVVLNRRQEAP